MTRYSRDFLMLMLFELLWAALFVAAVFVVVS